MTQHPPQFHRFGVHIHNSQDSRSACRDSVFGNTMGEGQVGRPTNNRNPDGREYVRSEKVHLNDKKRVSIAKAVVTYFRDLHHDGSNHLTPPNHNRKVFSVCGKLKAKK